MKYIFPVASGLAATFLAGLILFPLVYVIFNNFFELYIFTTPPPDAWKNDLIIAITLILWIFFSSFAGGFFCSLVSEGKEDFHIFLLVLTVFIIGLIASHGAIVEEWDINLLFAYGSLLSGYILGGFVGLRYKKKKQKKSLDL
jgi:hypothetical protein